MLRVCKLLFCGFKVFIYRNSKDRAKVFRTTLEQLGPIFIKFGQLLSTRRDVIPHDLVKELELLQDKVKPFDSRVAIKIIENDFKKEISEIFKEFIHEPLASASISQVHKAKLITGADVVVKVLRPNVRKRVKKDIKILRFTSNVLNFISKDFRKIDLKTIVNELDTILSNELNLLLEAANASKLKRNTLSDNIYIPKVYWEYTKKNCFCLEKIDGISINDFKKLEENNIDFSGVAKQLVINFFTQVFRDSFFHADLHPGNIFILKNNDDFKLAFVDFGIMASLSEMDRGYLAKNLLAFYEQDYASVAKLHIESGWVGTNTKLNDFEASIREISEPLFDRKLGDISFGLTLMQLIKTAKKFKMKILPQLILLQKTIITVEGLARELDPSLEIWKITRPILESWLKEQVGVKGLVKKLKTNIPEIIDKLPTLSKDIASELKGILKDYQVPRRNNFIFGLSVGLVIGLVSSFVVFGISKYNSYFEVDFAKYSKLF